MFRKSGAGVPSNRAKGDVTRRPGYLTRHWAPVAIWLCFIFLMSTGTFSAENTFSVVGAVLGFLFPGLSTDTIAFVHMMVRKGAHVTEYFVLSLLLFRALKTPGGGWRWRYALCAMVGVALWALGDEFHQSFVPTRTASLTDVGIDTTGGMLGQFVVAAWHRLPWAGRKRHDDEEGYAMLNRKDGERPFWITLGAVLLGFAILFVLWFRIFA